MRSMDIAATGMSGQQRMVDVIANNIANVNTTSYKKNRIEFADLLYQEKIAAGAKTSENNTVTPTGYRLGTGVRVVGTMALTEQGTLAQTENDFDIAISGDGYFKIELPNGEAAYTRAGAFKLSPEGEIVNADGYTVQPGIVIPEDAIEISISKTGLVQYSVDDAPEIQEAGQMELAKFINPAGLKAVGGNLFLETAASGDPIDGLPGDNAFGTVMQRFLENSNVDIVSELVNLIDAQRAYDLNSKVIQTSDDMMGTVADLKR
ncbi:MAG: flagellar basal-body rod protein FlgG [Alphaproteobacteria bacterium]